MKKILFIGLCCLCLCGCNNNSNNQNENNNNNTNDQQINKPISNSKTDNNEKVYTCMNTNLLVSDGWVINNTLTVKENKVVSDETRYNYICSDITQDNISCKMINEYLQDCVFENGVCYLSNTDSDKTYILKNKDNSYDMTKKIITNYTKDNEQPNIKDKIEYYESHGFYCNEKNTN